MPRSHIPRNPFYKPKAAPRTETSLERIVRAALERSGLAFETQVQIGRYRVDFLVEQRIILEADSSRYHLRPEAAARSVWATKRVKHDTARDAFLETRGYVVVRARDTVFRAAPDMFIEEKVKNLLAK